MKTALILIFAKHHQVEGHCTSIFDVVFQLPYAKYWAGPLRSPSLAHPSMERLHSQVCELQIVQSVRLGLPQAVWPVEVGFYMIPTRIIMLVLQMSGDQVALDSLVLEPFAVYPRAESAVFVRDLAESEPLLVMFLFGLDAVFVWSRYSRSSGLPAVRFARH